ncbi:hypothetical protein TNCT_374531, partial [Trichonephila clavata]
KVWFRLRETERSPRRETDKGSDLSSTKKPRLMMGLNS